jgi:diadenosine tetraphosphatase ApaH/serine/threonine PP2A family protein phosphatase
VPGPRLHERDPATHLGEYMVICALANVDEDAFLAEMHRPYPNDPSSRRPWIPMPARVARAGPPIRLPRRIDMVPVNGCRRTAAPGRDLPPSLLVLSALPRRCAALA